MSKLNQPPAEEDFDQKLEREDAISEYENILYLAFSSDRGKSSGFFDYFRRKYAEWLFKTNGKISDVKEAEIKSLVREIGVINPNTERERKLLKIKNLVIGLVGSEFAFTQEQLECIDYFIQAGEKTFFERGYRENISEAMLWESRVTEHFV